MTEPPLRFLHSAAVLSQVKLAEFRNMGTDRLIESLRPGQEGALKTRTHGTVLEGHRRLAEEVQLVLEGEAAAAAASGIDFRAFPIPDRGVPASRESVADLAHNIVAALETGKDVAVHCRQGIGRSGIIVGVVLVSAGKDVPTALKTIAESRGLDVPETEEQQRWLQEFSSWLATRQAAAQQAAAADERRTGRRSNSSRS